MNTINHLRLRFIRFGSTVALLTLAGSTIADTVTVASRTETAKNTNPPYLEANSAWNDSSLKSSASGLDPARLGSRFSSTGLPEITITPTLGVAGTNGIYEVYVTHGSASSISPDVLMAISSPDNSCDISTNLTAAFQQTKGVNGWALACLITNHAGVSTPQVDFAYSSGMVGPTQSSNRIYADGFQFILHTDQCLSVPQLTAIDGPLAAGQTFVNVPGVDKNSTNVTVYANGVKIGALTSGIVSNLNTVTVSALVKGQLIAATQWSNGIESCLMNSGFKVGGGTSPRIRVSVSLREDPSLTGPIGADGGTSAPNIFFLGATGPASGFGTAPLGGRVITPGVGWQTVSFTNGADPAYFWAGSGIVPVTDAFATLESIALCLDDTSDTGPFKIYIDNVMNGSTVIENFESPTNGTVAYMFTQPSFSSTTSPYLLSPAPGTITPNVSQITTNNADTGNNCLEAYWQFKDTASSDWVRFATLGSGTPDPEVDLSKPISFRILVLPVGTAKSDLNISLVPDQTKNTGDTVTFNVTANGTGPFHYQWQFNGAPIGSATLSSYTKANLSTNDAGLYTVVVNNTDSSTSTSANLTVNQGVARVSIAISTDGSNVILNWPGSHTLQSAPAAAGPFTDVAGPVLTAPYMVPPSGTALYFRLRN